MSAPYPSVALRDSEVRTLTSASVAGQEYSLYVRLPRRYQGSEERYPVLYLLDGDQFLGMVADTVRLLQFRDGVPDVILVGIAYGTDAAEHFPLRMRDLSPTAIPELPSSGGADRFLQFVVEEAIPFVEAHYRVRAGERTLIGASIGGLFALYALLRRPDVFSSYIVSSPSVFWDDRLIFRLEREFAAGHPALPARLFLSVGGLEDPEELRLPIQELAATLASRRYEGLQLTLAEIEGETHFSVQPAAFARGLRAIFQDAKD